MEEELFLRARLDVLCSAEGAHMPSQDYMPMLPRAHLEAHHRERLVVWMKWLAEGLRPLRVGDAAALGSTAAAAATVVTEEDDERLRSSSYLAEIWPIATNLLDRTLSTCDVSSATDAEMLALTCVVIACKSAGAVGVMVSECVRQTPSLRAALDQRGLEAYEAFVLDAVAWRVHPVTAHEIVVCKMALLPVALRDATARHVELATACATVLYSLVGLPPSIVADAAISAALELMRQPSAIREEVCDTLAIEQTPYLWELQLHILLRCAAQLGALAEVELDRQLAGLRLCSDAASDAALSDAAPAAARRRAAAEDAATALTEIEGRRSSVNATQVLPCVEAPAALAPALLEAYGVQLTELATLGPPAMPPSNRYVALAAVARSRGAPRMHAVASSDGECAAQWFDAELWYCNQAELMLTAGRAKAHEQAEAEAQGSVHGGVSMTAGAGMGESKSASSPTGATVAAAGASTACATAPTPMPQIKAHAAAAKAKARRARSRRAATLRARRLVATPFGNSAEWDAAVLGSDACRSLCMEGGAAAPLGEQARTYAKRKRARSAHRHHRNDGAAAMLGKRARAEGVPSPPPSLAREHEFESPAKRLELSRAPAAAVESFVEEAQCDGDNDEEDEVVGRAHTRARATPRRASKRLRVALSSCDLELPCARTVMLQRLVAKLRSESALPPSNRSQGHRRARGGNGEGEAAAESNEVSVTFPSSWATQKAYGVAQWLRRNSVADFRTEINGKDSLWPRTGELHVFAPKQIVCEIEYCLRH
jgi:hypothetical protein